MTNGFGRKHSQFLKTTSEENYRSKMKLKNKILVSFRKKTFDQKEVQVCALNFVQSISITGTFFAGGMFEIFDNGIVAERLSPISE